MARWERDGKVILYPMNRERMENSVSAPRDYSPCGADSVAAALAQELNMPLRAFDNEILRRVPGDFR